MRVMLIICQFNNVPTFIIITRTHFGRKFLLILLNFSINHILFFAIYTLQLFHLIFHQRMLLYFYIIVCNYDLFPRHEYKVYLLSRLFFILQNKHWCILKQNYERSLRTLFFHSHRFKYYSNEDHFYIVL